MTIDLKSLTKAMKKEQFNTEIVSTSNKDIAVIGIACRFAAADNKEEYWKLLKVGEDAIRELPENRKKLNEAYLKVKGHDLKEDGYFKGGFLQEVDKFDYGFFNISPLEASLMSPNQRMFLETAWNTIEDAGYGGGKITGSKTGVFLGHSTDFGISYKEFVETLDPSLMSFSISGNLNSIIASRISYLFDLKGPSMIVDTACSSSLTAVHLACRSLRSGECDMALAGAVKIDLLPLNSIKKKEDEIGITSSDGRARAFDDSAEGTGLGEGIGVILLKPLAKAVEEGDNIYAVVKGSATNQDGSSANLTSPNPSAQEEVIIKAWRDAGIDPETLTYIEAHGTGTELGDPIEISGMEKAFRRYTDKKQFCAIGSVKTNIGHLDHAAGMAGLIKAILALKYKQIPPTIHFKNPNRKINFEDSPVYVNDILRDWKTDGFPRRCGVSAFGLSGTNCHVVLEEFQDAKTNCFREIKNGTKILTLSAKSKEGILELIWQYQLLLRKQEKIGLNDVCYTANTGRGHYSCRLAVAFEDINDLKKKLERAVVLSSEALALEGVYYGEHRIVSEKQQTRKAGEITQSQKSRYTKEINDELKEFLEKSWNLSKETLYRLCDMYVQGADIEWELLYKSADNKRISLPVYPFVKKVCWVDENMEADKKITANAKEIGHPLFEKCLADSFDRIIYQSRFDVKNYWILNEHRVAGAFVVPGTVYLEMITELLKRHYDGRTFQLRDVVFLSPLALESGETIEVHTVVKNNTEDIEFTIAGRSVHSGNWEIHAEGKAVLFTNRNENRLDIERIKETCWRGALKNYPYNEGQGIETGPRWDCQKELYVNEDEILAYFCLDERYKSELTIYNLHPALLDEAVNVALRSVGEGLYLPFSYKSMTILRRLPGKLFSYVKRKNANRSNKEFASFDITLMDETGEKIVLIEDYTIKKVEESGIAFKNISRDSAYSQIVWKEQPIDEPIKATNGKNVLLIKGQGEISDNIAAAIKAAVKTVIEVASDYGFSTGFSEKDYLEICTQVIEKDIEQIVYMYTLSAGKDVNSVEELRAEQRKGVYNLFHLIRAMVKSRFEKTIDIVLIAQYANEIEGHQKYIMPHNAALFGLGKVINLEYPKIKCRCIDIDDYTQGEVVVSELGSGHPDYLTAYRSGKRFIPYLEPMDMKKIPEAAFTFKEQGVYVITGGTGSIGLEIARFISSKAKVNIALINRSAFPVFEKWNEIVERGEDTKLCNKIDILSKVRQNGSNIALYNSDISDMARMKAVLDELRVKFGKINGVFHAAGNAGENFIIRKDEDAFRRVLAPKIDGTWILDRLTQEDDLDFFVMFSSVSSILAEAGQGDYAAANSYLDAYTHHKGSSRRRYITINWPAWAETGMAVNYAVDLTKEVFSPVKTKEALNSLQLILNKNIKNIILGELNYSNYTAVKSDILNLSSKIIASSVSRSKVFGEKIPASGKNSWNASNIALAGRKDEDGYTESERKIAGIIGNILGLREVNVYDEFFELGGNSIVAVKVEMDMEKNGLRISVPDIYEYKTVKDLAAFIDDTSKGVVFENKDAKSSPEEVIEEDESEEDEAIKVPKSANDIVVLDNIIPFNKVFYKTCFHNSLFSVIRHFDRSLIPIQVNDIFIYEFDCNRTLSQNGMRDIFDKTLCELLTDMGIAIRTKTHICSKTGAVTPRGEDIYLLNQFSRYIGPIPVGDKNSTDNLLSDIKQALSQGRPVLLWVDCFYESIRKDTYNKEHWMHTLCLYGFDDRRKVFHVVEHNFRENLTYKKQEISYKDIKDAYEGFIANYMPYAEMPTYYEFFLSDDTGDSIREMSLSDYKEVYRKNTLRNRDKVMMGLESLKRMVDNLGSIVMNEQELESNIEDVITVLNSIIKAKQLEHYNLLSLFGSESNILNDIEKVVDLWNQIRLIIVKYSYSSAYDRKKMMLVVEGMNRIYESECKINDEWIQRL